MFSIYSTSDNSKIVNGMKISTECTWYSESDFIGFASIMGAEPAALERYQENGVLVIRIAGVQHVYQKLRRLAIMEEDLDAIDKMREERLSHDRSLLMCNQDWIA